MANPLATSADIPSYLTEFLDSNQYLYFASVSGRLMHVWRYHPKVTATLTAAESQLSCSIDSGRGRTVPVCNAGAKWGRFDLVECAQSNGFLCDDDTGILYFCCGCGSTGASGTRGCATVLLPDATSSLSSGPGRLAAHGVCVRAFDAASGGYLDVLQWSRSSSCSWDATTCSSAARRGHLPILQ